MTKQWRKADIRDLINYSVDKFETMIPCATQILELLTFILNVREWHNKEGKAKLLKQEKEPFLFRVFSVPGKDEIEVPSEVVWVIVNQLEETLDDKCDYLAELCGYNRITDTI